MLPDDLVDFLNGPYSVSVATRDGKLKGAMARAFGVVVEPENDQVTIFIIDEIAGKTYENLRDNGRISLMVGITPAHVGYQFKGEALEVRPSTTDEQTLQEIHQKRVVQNFRPAYGEAADRYFGRHVPHPSTAVTVRIHDVFDQTPGPGAGRKIWSAA